MEGFTLGGSWGSGVCVCVYMGVEDGVKALQLVEMKTAGSEQTPGTLEFFQREFEFPQIVLKKSKQTYRIGLKRERRKPVFL